MCVFYSLISVIPIESLVDNFDYAIYGYYHSIWLNYVLNPSESVSYLNSTSYIAPLVIFIRYCYN